MIAGVKVKTLQPKPDNRGRLMEILRSDDDLFIKFGQVYVTTVYPDVVKAWHMHKIQSDNVACVSGMIQMALYDARENSPTYKKLDVFYIGDFGPMLVQIPPGIYHGWKGVSTTEAIVINCSTEPYNHSNPDEYRLAPDTKEIPFDWWAKRAG